MTDSLRGKIRKALESPLNAAIIAAGVMLPAPDNAKPAVQWGSLAFNRPAVTPGGAWFRFSVHWGPRQPIEAGQNPRIEQTGFAKIGVFTDLRRGEDLNDKFSDVVRLAYPYDAALDREGIRVIIGAVEHGDAVPSDAAWLYSPVNVPWTVWRAE